LSLHSNCHDNSIPSTEVILPPDSDPPPAFTSKAPSAKPIQVARKIRWMKCSSVFLDDWGFPDQSHKFDVILHNIQGGPILCKCKHAVPPLDKIDPQFHSHYNASETQFLGIPSFHPLAIIINYHRGVIYGYDQKFFFVRKLFCYQYHFIALPQHCNVTS
jgi:hypothetical protein